ncbi:MAG: gamma-glutamyl-gamma-aminobutyrate hydrolase family protein [Candidatus Kapaibacterium sp.]
MKKIAKNRNVCLYIIAALLGLLVSCQDQPEVKIIISKGSGSEHYEMYEKWIKSINPNAVCIDAYNISFDKAMAHMDDAHGLLLSGGPDVHPARFGRAGDTALCEIDLRRDTLEFALISKALDMGLPIMAICRGEQILNVALGGSLIVDIPTEVEGEIGHREEHTVVIKKGTMLNEITLTDSGMVNSNHHQAVDKLAPGLIATAFSPDGLIEAFEWEDPYSRPFMIAVQWHPERLEPYNTLSRPLGKVFLKHSEAYKRKAEALP